jgi:hypothetical protein
MLEEERLRFRRIPDTAHTVAFGLTRRVPVNTPITYESGRYSVPAYLLGATVFVRTHGAGLEEHIIIIVHLAKDGPVEVARHGRARPGTPAINDEHFPDHKD